MPHLTDDALNEYLDGVLDEPAQEAAEAHLAVCADCRRRHAELHRVFSLLSALPDQPLSAGLRMQPSLTVPRWLKPLAIAQALAAAAFLAAGQPGVWASLGARWPQFAAEANAWLAGHRVWLAQLWAFQAGLTRHTWIEFSTWAQYVGGIQSWPVSSLALLAACALAAGLAGLRLIVRTDQVYLIQRGHHGTDR